MSRATPGAELFGRRDEPGALEPAPRRGVRDSDDVVARRPWVVAFGGLTGITNTLAERRRV
jgi:hypothetical protein